jgi:hypothetical protein
VLLRPADAAVVREQVRLGVLLGLGRVVEIDAGDREQVRDGHEKAEDDDVDRDQLGRLSHEDASHRLEVMGRPSPADRSPDIR